MVLYVYFSEKLVRAGNNLESGYAIVIKGNMCPAKLFHSGYSGFNNLAIENLAAGITSLKKNEKVAIYTRPRARDYKRDENIRPLSAREITHLNNCLSGIHFERY